MKATRLTLSALLALSLTVPFVGGATPIESLPLDEVKAGMVGEGLSVFSGNTIEPFKVHILGVLRNYGPNQNMILARLEGANLEHTGVIAGMSGSPVYVEEKLIGAVAFAFPFAKDPIAGITPIEEMVEATATPARRRPAARLQFPLEPDAIKAQLGQGTQPVPVSSQTTSQIDALHPYLGQSLIPISTPTSIRGFGSEALEAIAPLFRALGMEPFAGGAVSVGTVSSHARATATATAGSPVSGVQQSAAAVPLRPGDSVGVGLVTGDLDIVATGTVTHTDELTGAVYAFGHPLFNLGPIQYPMMSSEVHLVLPSLMNSFKMASGIETIGTWTQDRATAIKGLTNVRPKMIPMTVELKTSREQTRSYELEIIEDELFTPVLTYSSLIAILQSVERQFGTQTVKISAWLSTDGDQRININDIFTDQQAAVTASAMVAAPLSFLMTNTFQPVSIKSIDVEVEAEETIESAALVRAWLDSDEAAPGGEVELKLLLRSYRGEEMLESVKVAIPQNVGEGTLQLLVADASTVSSIERRAAGQGFVPKDMNQLVRAINALRKNNRLYVRLSRSDRPGAMVAGEYMTSLPPSVAGVLRTDDSTGSYRPLRGATIYEQEIVTDFDVTGARRLSLAIKRP